MANNPKPEYIYIDGTPININNPKNKKLLKEFKRDADRITRKEDGGEIVPKKYKGFSKLPETVQKKIDPDLANKYVKGGPVRQTIEVKSDKTAGPRGYTQKTSETFYRDKSTGGKFVNTKDKPRKPQGIKMAKGGEVKGGTSSQMSGQHYKGIF
jgi:hypothetical protein